MTIAESTEKKQKVTDQKIQLQKFTAIYTLNIIFIGCHSSPWQAKGAFWHFSVIANVRGVR
jgi:hypothetical protein